MCVLWGKNLRTMMNDEKNKYHKSHWNYDDKHELYRLIRSCLNELCCKCRGGFESNMFDDIEVGLFEVAWC